MKAELKAKQENKIKDEIELTKQVILKCKNCDCEIKEGEFKGELDSKGSGDFICKDCYDKMMLDCLDSRNCGDE